MGKKEFANQQPTQNLAGRGRRGIQNTVHTKGETKSRVSIEPVLPLLAIPWSWSWDLHGSLSPLPPLPFSFKLTKKHGIPKSQHSAGQVPLAANVQPNKKKKTKTTHAHKRKLHPSAELWFTWKFQKMNHVQSRIGGGFFLKCLQWTFQSPEIRVNPSAVGNKFPICSWASLLAGT